MKKEYRIKKTQDIEKIIKNKKYQASPYFVIYKLNNPETSHYRYAISVSKKLGNAVTRNKIKRQIRASIRELNVVENQQIDFFIVAKSKVLNLDHNGYLTELLYLLNKQRINLKGEIND